MIWEAADLVYFTMVAMARHGVSASQVLHELDRRSLVVRRRDGSATFPVRNGGAP